MVGLWECLKLHSLLIVYFYFSVDPSQRLNPRFIFHTLVVQLWCYFHRGVEQQVVNTA